VRSRPRTRRTFGFIAGWLLVLAIAPGVGAHDDPPGHYLETDLLYPAFANRPTPELELQLGAMLQASAAKGYPIKVALVGSEDDLTDPEMLGEPQRYAELIAAQLTESRVLKAPILVVSPFGLGLSGAWIRDGQLAVIDSAEARALVGAIRLPDGAGGDDLARTAMTEVRELASSAGKPLPATIPVPPAFVPPPRPASAGGAAGDLGILFPAAVGIGVFFGAWLLYEAWSAVKERRRAAPP